MTLRNLLLSVLSTTATKREARQYIQKYADADLLSIVRISGRHSHAALSDEWRPGLARTLKHMRDLGTRPLVVLDGSPQIAAYLGSNPLSLRNYEAQLDELSEGLAAELAKLGAEPVTLHAPLEVSSRGVALQRDWLTRALASHIPILLPAMYDVDTNESKLVDSAVLCRELATFGGARLDKVVFVDPLGGLPSHRRKHAAHVLVNLKQEFGEIGAEIRAHRDSAAHLGNLELMNELLALGGSQATGIITDPRAAASHTERNPVLYNVLTDRPLISPSLPLGLRRTQLRTSLLRTGFPVYVRTSLPVEPLGETGKRGESGLREAKHSAEVANAANAANTVIGAEVGSVGTQAGEAGEAALGALGDSPGSENASSAAGAGRASGLDLRREDKVGHINLTRLQHLLELSFRKRLDLEHYLQRIANTVAAIIVVGDYDGVAIITWEQSPGGRRIAYLDKFAVDPSSQGAQGVADIMLIQMIRRLFPDEMVWRSRTANPVNKWYFERSRGHMKLDKDWTMFWISEREVPPVAEYEAVCRGIEPSLY